MEGHISQSPSRRYFFATIFIEIQPDTFPRTCLVDPDFHDESYPESVKIEL